MTRLSQPTSHLGRALPETEAIEKLRSEARQCLELAKHPLNFIIRKHLRGLALQLAYQAGLLEFPESEQSRAGDAVGLAKLHGDIATEQVQDGTEVKPSVAPVARGQNTGLARVRDLPKEQREGNARNTAAKRQGKP